MHPYLYEGSVFGQVVALASYPAFLALGYATGYLVSAKRARRLGIDQGAIEKIFFLCLFGSLAGGRLFHLVFERTLAEIGLAGGLTLYGGVVGGVAALWIGARLTKYRFVDVADAFGPAALLGIGLGRVGCFLAGCCWGTVCSLPWAVMYEDARSLAHPKLVPLHPVQLYEAACCFVLFFVVTLRQRTFPGQPIALAVAGYSVARFLLEYFRGDSYRGFLFGGLLSTSQFLALVALGLSGLGLWIARNAKEPLGARR